MRSRCWIVLSLILCLSRPAWGRRIEYRFSYGSHEYRYTLDADDYEWCQQKYKRLPHDWDQPNNFILYDPCGLSLKQVADTLWNWTQSLNLSLNRAVEFVLNMIGSIPYQSDSWSNSTNYVRYPFETLIDQAGDCEDNSLLFSAILSHWCVDNILIDLGSHIAVGVSQNRLPYKAYGIYWEHNNDKYYHTEPVGCSNGHCGEWHLGEELEKYAHIKRAEELIDVYLFCGREPTYDELTHLLK